MSYRRHDWEDTTPNTPAGMLGEPTRRCRACGVEQYQTEEHQWMRVVSRYWTPKVSPKCEGERDEQQ